MFHLDLFRIRAFAAGNLAALLAAMARGGLQFILIIWLQGIWLPEHGYAFTDTPLWAGIYMLPLIVGLLLAGPAAGWLSDRFGARPFATGGVLVAATSFALLIVLPVDFSYVWFALILLLNGIGMGLFQSPNTAGVMNSLPRTQRGAGAGMLATFNTSSSVLSIGIFFSLMIIGLASGLPHALHSGLVAHGVSNADATRISHLPPVATRTIRYYGELGRLGAPESRPKGGHRLYTEADVARLGELIRLRDLLGLSLEELHAIVEAEDARATLRDRWAESGSDAERLRI